MISFSSMTAGHISSATQRDNGRRWLAIAGLPLLFIGASETAAAQPCQERNCVDIKTSAMEKMLRYRLQLTPLPAGTVIEFTPVEVRFTLKTSILGIRGADPVPTPLRICPEIQRSNTSCFDVPLAKPGQAIRGRVTALAPWAGKDAKVRLVVLAPPQRTGSGDDVILWDQVAIAETPLTVAARYEISLTGFEVLTTRSTVKDTVWANLEGMVKANPQHRSEKDDRCRIAGIKWCRFGARYGDAGDGQHKLVGVTVGPYELVPEREEDLRALFYIYNFGDTPWQEIGNGVANAFSTIGKVILSGYQAQQGGSQGFAQTLDDTMHQFHGTTFASCDGPLAADVIQIPNVTIDHLSDVTLDARTRATGHFEEIIPYEYREKDGDFRCDRRGSKYRVSYAVKRISWAEWAR